MGSYIGSTCANVIESSQIPGNFEFRTSYNFRHKGKLINKQVFWYIAETETMAVEISHEHREHLWLDWNSAMSQLTHEESKGVLSAAMQHMSEIGKLDQ